MNTKIIGLSTVTENKITLPDSFKKIITEPSYVEKGINRYWNTNKDYIKKWLGGHLKGIKVTYQDFESSGIERGFSIDLDTPDTGFGTFRSGLRHPLGYSGLPELSSTTLGFQLWSEKAYRIRKSVTNPKATGCLTTCLPKDTLVADHFIGTTPAASRLFKEYRDSGWDLPYILEEWILSEIINYLTIIITYDEHQKDGDTGKNGVARGDIFSIQEKIEGKHYIQAGIKLPLITTNQHVEKISIENNTFKYVTKQNTSFW
tara:strand:- start:1447 stop:2226 length:780 start_codon:yes stop_codon:yes gene_type:complete